MQERQMIIVPKISQVRSDWSMGIPSNSYVNGNYRVKVFKNLAVYREMLNPVDRELRPDFADVITFYLGRSNGSEVREFWAVSPEQADRIIDSIPSYVIAVISVPSYIDMREQDKVSEVYSILMRLQDKKVNVILEVEEDCFTLHLNIFKAWEAEGLYQELRVQVTRDTAGLIEIMKEMNNAVVDITLGLFGLDMISHFVFSGLKCHFRGYMWFEHQDEILGAEKMVQENLSLTRIFFPDMLTGNVNLSFDWLALDQLDMLGKGFKGLDEFYRDFWVTSLYVDIVRGVYAYNKVSDTLKIQDRSSVIDMFHDLQKHHKLKLDEAPIGGYAERTKRYGWCPKCRKLASHIGRDIWVAEDKPDRVSRECWCDCGEKWFENYKWVKQWR